MIINLIKKEVNLLRADLHTHSTASDGLSEPAEIVRQAKQVGLSAVSLTDHDAVLGIDEAVNAGEKLDIEVIPGIEISTLENGQDVHILGYFINHKNKEFLHALEELQKVRDRRNEMMISKLNDLGIEITLDEVTIKLRRDGANIGRPHIGEVLLDKGVVKSMEEAFDKYLGKNGKAYINPVRISPEEGIDLIRKAGGVPVLAHPGVYDDDVMVARLIKYGLVGIEAFHPDHDSHRERKYRGMAERYGVLATGGSDFHGSRSGVMFHAPIGKKTVLYEVVEKLKQHVGKI